MRRRFCAPPKRSSLRQVKAKQVKNFACYRATNAGWPIQAWVGLSGVMDLDVPLPVCVGKGKQFYKATRSEVLWRGSLSERLIISLIWDGTR
jgi:hypothetical protein